MNANSSSSAENEMRIQLVERFAFELPVLRARLGLSQADVAKEIGISRQTYNLLENVKKKMNWVTFVTLVTLFKSNPMTKQLLDNYEDEL